MRKVFLVLIVMSFFFPMAYADDCDSCRDGVEKEKIEPDLGQDILSRLEYYASFVDVPCSGTACHGWVYLDGDTQYARDSDPNHVYAIVLEDDGNNPKIACAFLGDALTLDDLGSEELDDPELVDWIGDPPVDLMPLWDENEDVLWGLITYEDEWGYPDDSTCARYTTYDDESPITDRKLNIHQDLYPSPGLIEGAYYFGNVWYKRLSEDDSATAFLAFEVMSYGVAAIAMSGENFKVDQSWQEFKGGNCFYVIPHTGTDHGIHTPGHEITIVLPRGDGNGEAIVDSASLKQLKRKNEGIRTSSTKGGDDGKWVYVDPEFRFRAPGLIPPSFRRSTFSIGWISEGEPSHDS